MQGSDSTWKVLDELIDYYLETNSYMRGINHFNLCQLAQVLSVRESKDRVWRMVEDQLLT